MTDIALSETGIGPADTARSSRRAQRWARFRRRFHAWWEGIELPREIVPSPPASAPPAREEQETGGDRAADAWRIEAAELIWGEDFVGPGGAAYPVTLAKPLALTPAMSVLELGAGLGGAARALVAAYGVWVTGLERDADLVAEAKRHATLSEIHKKATIRAYDPATLDLKKQSVDCILAREAFHEFADKESLFTKLKAALKEGGQLLFTDYVRGPATEAPAFEEWARRRRVASEPVTVQKLQTLMKASGFDCRIAQDTTEDYYRLVVGAWSALEEKVAHGGIPRQLQPHIMDAVEHWTLLLRAFDAAELRCYRFHAFRR